MGHIYRELKEIPLPEEAKINHYDGQVSIYYKDARGARRRVVIGKATSETTMHPNDNFKFHFPQLWAEHFGKSKTPASQVHVGLYALLLGLGYKTGIYQDVLDCFGPLYGNGIMDFAAYSIIDRSSTASLFADVMQDQMLFSRKVLNDSWLSQLFSKNMTRDMIDSFRLKWLQRCVEAGTDKVWLCIDGSNNDCATSRSELAEPGHAKSMRQTNIISYIWAVNAQDGRPVTWFVNNGGMPDCKAIQEVLTLLGRANVKVEGVILDRGFASQEVFESVAAWNMDHIVMLKNDNHGFVEMMARHKTDIDWEVEHLVDAEDGTFGIADHVKVFCKSPSETCMGLFFNGLGSGPRRVKFIQKVVNELRRVRAKLPMAQDALTIGSGMDKFLELTVKDGMVVEVSANNALWGKYTKEIGYYAISSSSERSAKEIHDLYRLRNTSEKQFSTLKSQLGFDVTRSHSDAGIYSRFAVAFVAAILRTEIEIACKELKLDTNSMIRKTNRACCRYMPGDHYDAIMNLSTELKALLGRFDIQEAHLGKFAEELTLQMSATILSQVRTIPELEKKRRKSGAGPSKTPKDPDAPKRKPGRPKGSKNKKTLEREKELAEHPELAKPKRKPGRPKGSKNKATLERERLAALAAEKPRRGRPKGRKNNKTLERERLEAELARQQERRGRPRGRKNNKTLERERLAAEQAQASASATSETGEHGWPVPNEQNPVETVTKEQAGRQDKRDVRAGIASESNAGRGTDRYDSDMNKPHLTDEGSAAPPDNKEENNKG